MFGPTAVVVREFANDTIVAWGRKSIREFKACLGEIVCGDDLKILMVDMRETRKIEIDNKIVDQAFMRHLKIAYWLTALGVRQLPMQNGFLSRLRRRRIEG